MPAGANRRIGAFVDLEDTYRLLRVTEYSGGGYPPIVHNLTSFANLDGAVYQSSKIDPRHFMLSGTFMGPARPIMHSIRKAFIDAAKLDLTPGNQAIWLRYTGGSTTNPVEIACYLDQDFSKRVGGYLGPVGLRLVCPDPYFYEDGSDSVKLSMKATLADADFIVGRVKGAWAELGTGMNNFVRAMVVAPDGSLYVGGDFTTASGTTVNRIAKWDGSAWSTVGGTSCNAGVYSLAMDAAGNLWAGGNFTACPDGVAANRIAYWDGTDWNACGTGANGKVYTITVGHDGKIWAGGAFTDLGGVAAADYLGYWDGAAWNAAFAVGHERGRSRECGRS